MILLPYVELLIVKSSIFI